MGLFDRFKNPLPSLKASGTEVAEYLLPVLGSSRTPVGLEATQQSE